MITSRDEITRRILSTKVQQNMKWADVAKALGRSKEWTTAACLGQMQLTKKEATQLGILFQLDDEVNHIYVLMRQFDLIFECIAWLQIAPHKSSSSIPSDPLLYRFYEVNCSTILTYRF